MKSGGDNVKPHDDVPLTDFEKRVFRSIIFGAIACSFLCASVGMIMGSSAWIPGAVAGVVLALIIGIFWFIQECVTSLRDYGLGEGVANLYGEDRAKFQFGSHYMRPDRADE